MKCVRTNTELTFSPFMKLVIVIISEKNESFIACRGIFALSCENFQVSIMLAKYCNRDPDCIHKVGKCHSQRENLTLFKHQDQ